MTKTFTENEMILALYGETGSREQSNLQLELLTNQETQDLFLGLLEVKNALDRFELQLPKRVTDRILKQISNRKEMSL